LVEPTAYSIDIETALKEAEEGGKKKGPKGKKGKKKTSGKHSAQARGVKRGAVGGNNDQIFLREQPVLHPEADDEGLLVFVQTGLCRRLVLTAVYHNPDPGKNRNLLKMRDAYQFSQRQRFRAVTIAFRVYWTELDRDRL
jgi:hypothetical protein